MLKFGYNYIIIFGCIFLVVWYNIIGDIMKCENLFCIYQSGDYCTLDCTELDIQGQCKECIYPDIDNTVLSEIKAKHLEKCYE